MALTYSRAYRLTRALLDSGPIRLAPRGQFSHLVEELSTADQQVLHERLADPRLALLTIVDPRPLIRTAGAIQNTYTLSLLQAETRTAAVTHGWPIRFAESRSASETARRRPSSLVSISPRSHDREGPGTRPAPGGTDRHPSASADARLSPTTVALDTAWAAF